jgi:ubiquitin C-terminal hydrolase
MPKVLPDVYQNNKFTMDDHDNVIDQKQSLEQSRLESMILQMRIIREERVIQTSVRGLKNLGNTCFFNSAV